MIRKISAVLVFAISVVVFRPILAFIAMWLIVLFDIGSGEIVGDITAVVEILSVVLAFLAARYVYKGGNKQPKPIMSEN